MTFSIRHLTSFALVLLGSLSCAEQHRPLALQPQNRQSFQAGNLQLLSHNIIEVVDDKGQPIAGATILIGLEPGNPFGGNVLTTDTSGHAAIPADWKSALAVTVQAPGFITSTIPVALPGDQAVRMNTQESAVDFEVAGAATDFGRLPTDGKVDFALVIAALTRESLLSFELGKVMSVHSETIEIVGSEVEIPSNLSLPPQRETFVFPIDFDKPNYRSFVRQPGSYLMTTARGQFPLQRVVNEIRNGKSIFEVVNHFNFIEGGFRLVAVQDNMAGIDIPVNQVQFNTAVHVQAPTIDSGLVMLSMALMEKDGLLIPSDLKRLTSGQALSVKTNATVGPASVLSLLLEEATAFQGSLLKWFKPLIDLKGGNRTLAKPVPIPDFKKFSYTFLPATGGVAPQFLPLVNQPVLTGNVLQLDIPKLSSGLTAVGTYLVLNEVEEIMVGDVKNERRTRLWEVWSNAWLAQVELPAITFNRRPDRKYRWEAVFMARPANFVGRAESTGIDLNSITHVTRNATDI